MGVNDLWTLLKPASIPISFREWAIKKGFEENCRGDRTVWVGVDASNWLFTVSYRHGTTQNPELIALLMKCERLAQLPVKAHFVFDGAQRPSIKRNTTVKQNESWLVGYFKQILGAFGFTHSTALGEAEVELSLMSQANTIDVVLTEDSDSMVFGTAVVARERGLEQAQVDNFDMLLYRSVDVASHPSLGFTSLDLVFIALAAGGDYDNGIQHCGMGIASALARSGFGRRLPALLQTGNSALADTLRLDMRNELRMNTSNYLPALQPKLASDLSSSFPEPDIIRLYLEPTAHLTRSAPFSTAPYQINLVDLAKLASTSFQWGKHAVDVIKRFSTFDFPALALRELIADANAADANSRHVGKCIMLTAVVGERSSPETCFLNEVRVALAIPPVLLKSICECLPDWPLSKSAFADLEELAKRSRAWLPRVLVEHAHPELLTAYKSKISKNKHDGSSKANASSSSSLAMTRTPRRSPQKATPLSTPTNRSHYVGLGKKRRQSSSSEVEVSKISPRAFSKKRQLSSGSDLEVSEIRGHKRARKVTVDIKTQPDGTEVWELSSESCSTAGE